MKRHWHVQEFEGVKGLHALRPDWERLVGEMPSSGFEHAYEVHRAYFQHLSKVGSNFRFLALSDGEGIRAICPLEVTMHTLFRRPVACWGLAAAHVNGFSLDWICPDGDAMRELLPRVQRHLRESRRGPAWLVFDRVLEGSVLWQCMKSMDPSHLVIRNNGARSLIDCQCTFEQAATRFSAHHRNNLNRYRKRLAALGHVRFECATTQPSLNQSFEAFIALEATGWKGKEGARGALRFHPDQLAFYGDLVESLGAAGRCEIHSLHVGDRCIAMKLCFLSGNELASFKICYDESAARLAPGVLLTEHVLASCCERRQIQRYNFVSHNDGNLGWRPDVVPAYAAYVPLRAVHAPLAAHLLRVRQHYGSRIKRLLRWTR